MKLYPMINALLVSSVVSSQFAERMHNLRKLGNKAAHGHPLPPKENVEVVVQQYIDSKKQFEMRK